MGLLGSLSWRRALRAAARLVARRGPLGRVVAAAAALFARPGTGLGGARHDAAVLLRLARATVTGRYRQLPKAGLLALTAGLVYFLNPLDLIPDVLPLLGFVDDATVLLWVARQLRKEITAFTAWEREWGGALDVEGHAVSDPALTDGLGAPDLDPPRE